MGNPPVPICIAHPAMLFTCFYVKPMKVAKMPILKGTMSYTRFRVRCESDPSPQFIVDKLNLFRFRPLNPRGEDMETLGWCPYLSEYDDEKSIDGKDCLYDNNVVLVLRLDSISLPKALLKSLVKKSLAEYQRDHQKTPDRVVRKEIELAEAKGLRARILPKTKMVEGLFCQKTQELRIFSRSTTLVERFVELFQQTLMMKLERRDFAVEAHALDQRIGLKIAIENLSHQPIFMPPLRTDVQ